MTYIVTTPLLASRHSEPPKQLGVLTNELARVAKAGNVPGIYVECNGELLALIVDDLKTLHRASFDGGSLDFPFPAHVESCVLVKLIRHQTAPIYTAEVYCSPTISIAKTTFTAYDAATISLSFVVNHDRTIQLQIRP